MQDTEHLAGFGIEVGEVKYDREKVAAHAAQLVSNVAKNLGGSLTALGVDQVCSKDCSKGCRCVVKTVVKTDT